MGARVIRFIIGNHIHLWGAKHAKEPNWMTFLLTLVLLKSQCFMSFQLNFN